ncbi:MAG: choice-of-anchor tandem repeat GloVer-containing protein [Bacteroidota bacterium]
MFGGINGKLYGSTREGGPLYSGTFFEFDPAGGFRMLANNGPYGAGGSQRGEVSVSSSGKIYAVTSSGGANGNGAVLEINPNDAPG